MATIVWTGAAGDGNFNNPDNWSPKQVPGAADTVTIDPSAATAITVSNDAVGSLTTNKFVTLNVANNTSLTFGAAGASSTFSNGGTLALDSSGNATDLIVAASSLTLTGGGTVELSVNGNNTIVGAAAGDVLDNVNNLIEGAGQLGGGTLTFINGAAGVVNANIANGLVLNTGAGTISNSGLLEATGSGGLTIESVVSNSGKGLISAAGGNVYLAGATIEGGTLTSSAGGAIFDSQGATLNGATTAVTNDGTLVVSNNESMSLLGSLTNAGSLILASAGNSTDLIIASAKVTLGGKGTLLLTNNGNNIVRGAAAADELNNVNNLIEGAGQLGAGTLTFVNGAAGVVNANESDSLTLNTGAKLTTNSGVLESTSSGGLYLQSVVNDGTSGKIEAAGGNVYLQGATIEGGTLTTSGGADIFDISTATLNGVAHTVANNGTVVISNNTSLDILGTITNAGTIVLASAGNITELVADATGTKPGTVTLTGGGTVFLSPNGNNIITGAAAGDTLINLNNTLDGTGQFSGPLNLINDAIIDSNALSSASGFGLLLNAGVTVTNNGLLEATVAGDGGLTIDTVVNNSGGGTIVAAVGNVYLQNGSLEGGTIVTSGGGDLVETASGTLDGGSQSVTVDGTVLLNSNTSLTILGTIANNGTIILASAGNTTDLVASAAGTGAGTVTLTGNGTIFMSDNLNNVISGAVAGETLNNLTNTIEGAGQFVSGLNLINHGIIDSNAAANALILNAGVTVTNDGLLEATVAGDGGLVISAMVNDSGGGTILAAAGNVYLAGGTISGGTIESNGGGGVFETGGGTLDGSSQAVTNLGAISVVNNNVMYALGSIVNQGTIALDSGGNGTALIVDSATLTLTGGGTLALSDNPNNYIYGAANTDVLDNVNNLIEGAGQLGSGSLTLINATGGVIDATGGNTLTINTGTIAVSNSGLIEATGTGGLNIYNTTISNGTAGTMSANGGTIYLQGATISGGTLVQTGEGDFVNYANSTLNGSGTTVINKADIVVNNNTALYLLGKLTNDGTVSIASIGNGTDLIVGPSTTPGTATLTGGGHVIMSDNSNNYIYGNLATDTLINLNNTISGAGNIGNGGLVLVNDATIDASGVNALVIDTGSAVTNNKLMEATNTGGLVIDNAVNNSATATISALGGDVYLQNATISGGTITSAAGFAFVNAANSTLNGTAQAITNLGSIVVNNNTALYATGTLNNLGTLYIGSGGNGTAFIVGPTAAPGTFTLTGGGQLVMSDNFNNYIYGSLAGDTLLNLNNTISGAGRIGNGQMALINDATINANGTNELLLNTSGTTTNNGLIESTNTGGLAIQCTVDGSGGGTIAASGGNVQLQGGTLEGGTLTSGAGFAFYATGSATLDGASATLTNLATIIDENNNALYAEGAIDNQGMIQVASGGNGTALILEGATVTLTGSGTLALTDNGNNYVYGATSSTVLDNVSNVIEGAGNLGNGQLTLVDGGIIAATGGNTLFIDVGTTGTITSTGELLGIGAGGLSLENGTYTNFGLIEAEDGSSVTFQSNAVLTNDAGGTLTGGTYLAVDGGHGATLNLGGTTLTTLAATVEISGTGAAIDAGGASITTTLDDLTSNGTLLLVNGANFGGGGGGGSFIDNGLLELAGGTFTDTNLTIDQGAHFTGFGTLATNVVNNGTITITGGTLTITGHESGTGTTIMGSGGVIDLVGGGALPTNVTGNGTLELAVGAFTLANGAPAVTTIQVDSNASLSGTGTLGNTIIDSGVIAAQAGTLTLSGALSGTGMAMADAGAELAISGGGTFAGALSGAGTVLIGSALTLDQGAAINAAQIMDVAAVTLGANVSLNNGAGDVFTLSASSAPGADVSRHRAQIELTGAVGDKLTNAGMIMATGTGIEIIAVAFANSGVVDVAGGDLHFNKALSGGGMLEVAKGAGLSIAGGGSTFAGMIEGAGTVNISGVTTLEAGATLAVAKIVESNNLKLAAGESVTNLAADDFTLTATASTNVTPHRAQIELSGTANDSFTNLGTVLANGSGSEEIGVAFVNNGHVSATAGTLSFLDNVTGTGALSAATGAVIDLVGGATYAGAITGAGTVRFDGAVTLNAGASIAATNIVETDNLTLGASESIKIAAADTYTITTGTTGASNPPHRAQISLAGASGDSFTNGGTLAVNGTGSASFSLTVINSGNASVGSGTLSFLGAVTNTGTIAATAATAVFGTAIAGTGTLDVGATGTLSLLDGAAAGQTLDFLTTSGLVDLTTPTAFLGTIGGFGTGDSIDLIKTAETSYNFASGVLTVKDNTTVVASLKFAGTYTNADFTLATDNNAGTLITFK